MKRFLIFFTLIALICGSFSAYWFTVQSKITNSFKDAQTNFAQNGMRLVNSEPKTSGYPFTFFTNIDALSFDNGQGGSLRTQKLTLLASSLKPTHWTIESLDDTRIELLQPAMMKAVFNINSEQLKAEIGAGLNGHLKSIKTNIQSLKVDPISGLVPPIKTLESANIHIAPKNNGLAFTGYVDSLILSDESASTIGRVFGQDIQTIAIEGHAGGLQSLDLKRLQDWQHTGTLTVTHSTLIWGAANISGTANLQLSPLGPNGEIYLKAGNTDRLITALRRSGFINSKQAMGLMFASKNAPKSEDGKFKIAFPVKEGRVLFLGQPIYTLPAFNF